MTAKNPKLHIFQNMETEAMSSDSSDEEYEPHKKKDPVRGRRLAKTKRSNSKKFTGNQGYFFKNRTFLNSFTSRKSFHTDLGQIE